MVAKKAASKKRKKAGTGRKKTASKKAATRRKTASKKAAASRKQAKKSTRKKSAARKKPATRKASAKKTTKKKSTKKKSAKKKTAAKKASAKKKTSKKKAGKSAGRKKVSAKKTSKKKAASRKKPASRKKAAGRKKQTAAPRKAKPARLAPHKDVFSGPIHGIEPYQRRRGEQYMNDEQLEHFREILTSWKRELMNEVDRTLHHMQDEAANFPDPNDRATQESEFGLELRTRDRERKLLRKINAALARIDDGSYGYCEETGEEIGLKRLEARPVATLCVEAQERREMAERQFRDRDDRYR